MPRSQSKHQSTVPSIYTPRKMPAPHIPSPPPTVYQPPRSSFGQMIKEGVGFGAGQAIAHRAVNAILGPSATTTVAHQVSEPKESKGPCFSERTLFETCMRIKSQEDHCNNEHLAYTHCLELTKKSD